MLGKKKMNLIEKLRQERKIDNAQCNLEDLPDDLQSTEKNYTAESSTLKYSNSSKKTKKSIDSSNDSQQSREKSGLLPC